jgi:hypothetical protein
MQGTGSNKKTGIQLEGLNPGIHPVISAGEEGCYESGRN